MHLLGFGLDLDEIPETTQPQWATGNKGKQQALLCPAVINPASYIHT